MGLNLSGRFRVVVNLGNIYMDDRLGPGKKAIDIGEWSICGGG